MSNDRIISTVQDIDLLSHGIIEAHAGTGKTYTIVKLVLAMLERSKDAENFLQLKDILIVTYTEKAAGELKKRIQDGIAARIKELREQTHGRSLAAHLENCLNNMHEALTGTIHSVCLRLLQTWPFETGVHFSTQIASDEEGLERLLRESMRTEWQDETTSIPQALACLEKYGMKLEKNQFELIRKISLELINNCDLAIDAQSSDNRPLPEIIEKLENVFSEVKACGENLLPLLMDYRRMLAGLRESGKLEDKRVEAIDRVILHINTMAATGFYDIAFLSNPKKYGGSLTIYTEKERKNIPEHAALIDKAADEIKNHRYISVYRDFENLQSQLRLAVICEAAQILAMRYRAYKKQNGLISYNDMLLLMEQALYTENSVMLKTLREKLRYGIIDEFQDTSVLQWKIFKKIFLDAEEGGQKGAKMFIVGDPKQSIYSFQNADIQSYIAAKETITALGGAVYRLIDNYRSLPEVIAGYNAILKPKHAPECGSGEDWFLFGSGGGANNITYPADEKEGLCARPPIRESLPQYPLAQKAVQIISLTGSETEKRKTFAAKTCEAVKKLKGTQISIPDGLLWKELTLDYKDFAVIVETHALAETFIEEFRIHGIPCVKYKQTGVFNSAMARDLRAVLKAILKRDAHSLRTAALLTHFFNVPPHAINPKHNPAGRLNIELGKDSTRAAHIFDAWGFLADKQLWAQLFKSILEKTDVQQRLIRLTDGERRLCDLRQVIDYCIERLYRGSAGLEELVNHLERLYNNEETASLDKNIHTLSTEKSSVRILTMHASKGLEFPVVFVVNDESRDIPRSPNFLLWTDSNKKKRLTPYLSSPKDNPTLSAAVQSYTLEQRRERRRLLYVAITRPQVMLFAAMDEAKKDNGLSPHLNALLSEGNPNTALFDEQCFNGIHSTILQKSETAHIIPQDIPPLKLKPFITKQTSYSQLSRNLNVNRDIDRSEELHAENYADENKSWRKPLPGGRLTGDALHRAIEELLHKDDLHETLSEESALADMTAKYLKRGGILNHASEKEKQNAVWQASQYIKNALLSPIALPNGGAVVIADLPKRDRVPEMEFLLSFERHWIRGFMDLVLRVKNDKHPAHPYRYYIIDWKTDSLKKFDCETIDKYCRENHYDFQAKVYSHALDKYLRGILGRRYNPTQNLGGSMHIFLRGFYRACGSEANSNIWMRLADPTDDGNELRSRFNAMHYHIFIE